MRYLGNKGVTKLVLLLCVLMQAVALMPHHHHGDSAIACLGYGHRAESEACHTPCSNHTSHATVPFPSCLSHSITATQPEPRAEAAEEIATDHSPACGCPCCTESSFSFTLGVLLQVVLQTREGGPRIEPYLRSYLTDALPCRAPDFMC